MADLSTMILASLSKIWHLVPIVIAIILFKKFINIKDKKRRISKNEENEKNGLTLEIRAIKKYEELGYKVTHHKKENNEEFKGIDLLCNKDEKTLLVQCNNSYEPKSITDEEIIAFYEAARKYVKANNIDDKNVEFRYAIPYSDILHKSAIKILTDNSYNCKYMVI